MGRKVGNEGVPEFHAQTLPAGTAPREQTFEPKNDLNVAAADAANDRLTDPLQWAGSTSGDLHKGIGKPMQGMTSTELRHDGQHGRKHEKLGLTRYGMQDSVPGGGDLGQVNPRDDDSQRALDKDVGGVNGPRGNKGEKVAEDQPPESA